MRQFWLILLSGLVLHGSASAATSPTYEIYANMLNGLPPSLFGQELDASRRLITLQLESLHREWKTQMGNRAKSCLRYSDALERVTTQLSELANKLEGPAEQKLMSDRQLLVRTRLHLLIPAFFGLHALFKRQSEGGYATLDPNQRLHCAVVDREKIRVSFDQSVEQMTWFHRQALGNPGLLGLDAMIDRLLLLTDLEDSRRSRLSWTLLAGTTFLSIVFWQYAPAAVMLAAQKVFLATPSLMTSGTFAFATRSTAFAAEALAYAYLEHKINPPQATRPQSYTASWDEQLKEIENLASAKLNSPEMNLIYLLQLQAQVVMLYQPWLEANQDALRGTIGPSP